MIARRVYYAIKPYVDWRLRLLFRRWLARRKLQYADGVWPILESAGRLPDGWPGWPGGKRFAFVLTHDVEGQHGLDQVKKLVELERKLGFRSSFNLIPEGQYLPSKELRDWLLAEGFEVGVHDLHHDGSLFQSRANFDRQAPLINRYLGEWNAVGFRSAFMLHNLRWQSELEVLYDASTFDTDPFEPQPDGVGTIFPFWVPGRAGWPGYVELPYTLVQDSTLFLLLRKKTIAVWLDKLDWIANCGGMALVNVHPDYIDFAETGGPSSKQFPSSWYSEFLHLLKTKYHNEYWMALPREVANYVSRHRSILTAPARVLRSLS
jgi:hypothetical protein